MRLKAAACARARPGFDPRPCQWQGGLAHRACQQAVAAGIRMREECAWDWEQRGGEIACARVCLRPGFDPRPNQWLGGLAHRACQRRIAVSAHGGQPGLKNSGTTIISTKEKMGKCESLLTSPGAHGQEVTHLPPAPWSRRTDRHDERRQKRRFRDFGASRGREELTRKRTFKEWGLCGVWGSVSLSRDY